MVVHRQQHGLTFGNSEQRSLDIAPATNAALATSKRLCNGKIADHVGGPNVFEEHQHRRRWLLGGDIADMHDEKSVADFHLAGRERSLAAEQGESIAEEGRNPGRGQARAELRRSEGARELDDTREQKRPVYGLKLHGFPLVWGDGEHGRVQRVRCETDGIQRIFVGHRHVERVERAQAIRRKPNDSQELASPAVVLESRHLESSASARTAAGGRGGSLHGRPSVTDEAAA